MEFVEGMRWEPGASVPGLVGRFKGVGFQSTRLAQAAGVMYKMWAQDAKVLLSFTSNMVTSGLRELFAQLVELGLVDAVITTAGSVEEDIMKAQGERFPLTRFSADDIALHQKGHNRVGNIVITNDTYGRFEGLMKGYLDDIIADQPELTVAQLLDRLGAQLEDEHSILWQAHEQGVPVFCPAITDGAIGFHLYMAADRHPGFRLDVLGDFEELLFSLTPDDTKGFIALGGGVSKHFGLLGTMVSGGADLAVYMTTSTGWSGSMSGASTDEAKSWGKLKDDSDSATVIGDVTINFPLAAFHALERLHSEGKLDG